jgi:hypothetical protein
LSKFIHYFYSGRKWFGRKWRLSRHIREIGSDKKAISPKNLGLTPDPYGGRFICRSKQNQTKFVAKVAQSKQSSSTAKILPIWDPCYDFKNIFPENLAKILAFFAQFMYC